MGVRFEKWQALGNDYLIVEEPVDVRAVCDRHTGVGADGVLLLGPPDAPGFVARLRIFNPDGSEAELSGNGARQALMYLHHRGRTRSPRFSIQTAAGEVRAEVLDATRCRMDLGRARHLGDGQVAGFACTELNVGNPQCAIRIADRDALEALDLAVVGPPIEHDPRFPTARTCRSGPRSRPARSAPASSSAGWARRGRAGRARRARRSPTSCAAGTRR
jgi:diaminopimelate epimerase